jgi:hypothetical protein
LKASIAGVTASDRKFGLNALAQRFENNAIATPISIYSCHTLKSLIEEHACLDFSDFLSTLLAIFHVINKKFHPARLLTYLVKKQAGWNFFPTLLVYPGLLFY